MRESNQYGIGSCTEALYVHRRNIVSDGALQVVSGTSASICSLDLRCVLELSSLNGVSTQFRLGRIQLILVNPLSAPRSKSSGILASRSGIFGNCSLVGLDVPEANGLPIQLSNFILSLSVTSKKYERRHLLRTPLSYKRCSR